MHPFLTAYHNPATAYETLEQLAQEYQAVPSKEIASLATIFVEDYARAEAYFCCKLYKNKAAKQKSNCYMKRVLSTIV